MPVYVLREGSSNIFKVGRTKGDVDAVIRRLRTGNSQPLSIFEEILTDEESACEAFFHRHLREYRVVRGGGWEFFQVDPEVMRRAVANLRDMFDESRQLAREVGLLQKEVSDDTLLEPTNEDYGLFQRLLQIKREQDLLACECELIESKLKKRIGHSAGVRGIATWRTSVTRRYDEKVFGESDPELYGEVLERYYCIDTKRWKRERPEEYKQVQTTYFTPQVTRKFLLQKLS